MGGASSWVDLLSNLQDDFFLSIYHFKAEHTSLVGVLVA